LLENDQFIFKIYLQIQPENVHSEVSLQAGFVDQCILLRFLCD